LEPIVWARQFAGKCARHFESSQSEGEHFFAIKNGWTFGDILHYLHLFWVYFPSFILGLFPHLFLISAWKKGGELPPGISTTSAPSRSAARKRM
jgi:hypothetical protein